MTISSGPAGPTGKFGLDSKLLSLFSSASDIFGSGDAGSVFAAGSGSTGSGEAVRAALKGLERELNRLLGYKSDYTPGQKKRLETLQTRIAGIEKQATAKGFTADQLAERAELYREAYRIMGKDYVDVAGNDELQALTDQVDALLEPKLHGARKERLERLRKLEDTCLNALVANPDNETARARLRNVKVQIGKLVPPRAISRLSPGERRDYDALVDRINALANTDYLLTSRTRIRVEQIRASMGELEAQAAALGIGQSAPSAGEVARAYTRLG